MVVGRYYMPFAPHYAFSAHPSFPLHPKVSRQWALDTYSTVSVEKASGKGVIFTLLLTAVHVYVPLCVPNKWCWCPPYFLTVQATFREVLRLSMLLYRRPSFYFSIFNTTSLTAFQIYRWIMHGDCIAVLFA